MIDITTLSIEEINKLRLAISPRAFEEVPYILVLSRDCRSDSTKEWFAWYDSDRDCVILYKRGKRGFTYNNILPIDIFTKGIYRTGTSTYEVQPGQEKTLGNLLKWINKKCNRKIYEIV